MQICKAPSDKTANYFLIERVLELFHNEVNTELQVAVVVGPVGLTMACIVAEVGRAGAVQTGNIGAVVDGCKVKMMQKAVKKQATYSRCSRCRRPDRPASQAGNRT